MQINTLTPEYSVAGQISPDDVVAVKQAGFTAIICNRPDEEIGPGENAETIRAAAEAAGLSFTYNPVSNGGLTPQNVTLQGDAIASATGPVLAYCRSGMRSSVVWTMSQSGKMPTDDLIAAAAAGGYDLSGLRHQIVAAARG